MENAKILIVDDDSDMTEALRAMLESPGYTVVTAGDRKEGMEKIRSEKPDLLILDVMMDTWHDGFEMARQIRKDPQSKKTAILMLTGVKDKTGIEFKSTAGDPEWLPVDGFLDKPVESQILLAEVRKILTKKQSNEKCIS
jgi:CheY-like chemotaxis protein